MTKINTNVPVMKINLDINLLYKTLVIFSHKIMTRYSVIYNQSILLSHYLDYIGKLARKVLESYDYMDKTCMVGEGRWRSISPNSVIGIMYQTPLGQ